MEAMLAIALSHNKPIIHYLYATGWTLDRTVPNAVKAHTGEGMFDLFFFSQTAEGWRAWKKMKGFAWANPARPCRAARHGLPTRRTLVQVARVGSHICVTAPHSLLTECRSLQSSAACWRYCNCHFPKAGATKLN